MSGETVGFVGLGHLGGRMAARLIDGGVDLVVFVSDPAHAQAFVDEHGGRVAGSARELAEQAEIVFTCLPSEAAAEEVLLGEHGIAEGVSDRSGVVECSTISPQTAARLGDALRERGARTVDASVSGSTTPAEKGELVLLVGGDRELHDRCQPLFERLAKATFFLGESGNGARAKLVVNTMLGVAMQALAEAWTLGVHAGLDPSALAEVLSASDTVPVAHQPKVANLLKGEYPAQFPVRLMHKDFGLIDDLARACGAVMPITAVAAQLNAAVAGGEHEQDISAVGALVAQLGNMRR